MIIIAEINQQKFEIILKYNFGILVFLTMAIANTTSSMNKVNLLLILTLFLTGMRKWDPIISF